MFQTYINDLFVKWFLSIGDTDKAIEKSLKGVSSKTAEQVAINFAEKFSFVNKGATKKLRSLGISPEFIEGKVAEFIQVHDWRSAKRMASLRGSQTLTSDETLSLFRGLSGSNHYEACDFILSGNLPEVELTVEEVTFLVEGSLFFRVDFTQLEKFLVQGLEESLLVRLMMKYIDVGLLESAVEIADSFLFRSITEEELDCFLNKTSSLILSRRVDGINRAVKLLTYLAKNPARKISDRIVDCWVKTYIECERLDIALRLAGLGASPDTIMTLVKACVAPGQSELKDKAEALLNSVGSIGLYSIPKQPSE